MMFKRIEDLAVAIVVHGAPTGPPAIGLKQHLVRRGADVRCLYHPLNPEQGGRHTYERFRDGVATRREVHLPSRPPYTYPLDMVVPFARDPVDVWFGFDNLSSWRGLARRRRGRAQQVVHWAVDFVPDRFGPGLLTEAYDRVDRFCCRTVDLRVEVSPAALEARDERLGLDDSAAPAIAVPVGLWADEATTIPQAAFEDFRLLFVGHLVERMGVDRAIEAVALLAARGRRLALDVVGEGPLAGELERQAAELGVSDLVRFHGFLMGAALDARVAQAALALAPYRDDPASFTRYADPSKLKSYLAAGLPIVMTDVPPNAQELVDAGVASLVADEAPPLAAAIAALAGDEQRWKAARAAALAHARSYDWPRVLEPVYGRLGVVT